MLSQFTVVSGGGLLEERMAPRAGLTLKLKPMPSQLSLAPGGGLLEERVAPRAGLDPEPWTQCSHIYVRRWAAGGARGAARWPAAAAGAAGRPGARGAAVAKPCTNPEPYALTPGAGLLEERVAPRAGLPPLLVPLADRPPEALQWLGASFGLTQPLFNFWSRAGYAPVYLRQTGSDITGAPQDANEALCSNM